MSICAESALNVTACFLASGNGTCVLNNFYPLMTSVAVDAGKHGMVEGCVVISKSCKQVMYVAVLPPNAWTWVPGHPF